MDSIESFALMVRVVNLRLLKTIHDVGIDLSSKEINFTGVDYGYDQLANDDFLISLLGLFFEHIEMKYAGNRVLMRLYDRRLDNILALPIPQSARKLILKAVCTPIYELEEYCGLSELNGIWHREWSVFDKVAVKAETGKVVIEAAINTAIGFDFTPEINCLLRYYKAVEKYQIRSHRLHACEGGGFRRQKGW